MSDERKGMSRGFFLQSLLALSGLATAFAWFSAVRVDREVKLTRRRLALKDDDPVAWADVIVLPSSLPGSPPKVYRNKCTHLGCTLDVYPDGQIVCPCHGSAFDEDGRVLRGPARKDLQALEVLYDESEGTWYVEI